MATIKTKTDSGFDAPSLSDQILKDMGVKKINLSSRKTVDLSDPQKLIDYASEKGVTVDPDKPSTFRQAIDILSRGNYMSANVVKDFMDGGEFKPLQSAWRGLSGQDKTTYGDVLDAAGMENKILRGGLGFVLDVALDPTTYFGGTLIKGAGTAVKMASAPIGRAAMKTNPVFANHIIDAATSLKDAFGTAFKFGYNVTPGLSDEVTRTMNRIGMSRDEIINKYVDIFKPLDKAQQKQFAQTLIKTRKEIRAYEVKKVDELIRSGVAEEEAIKIARAEANAKFKPKFADQTQQDVFEKSLVPEIDNIATTAGLDDAFKVEAYYPIMDVTQMDRADKVGRVMAQGNKGYLNEFAAKLDDKKILDKPIEAYTRREMEVVRDALNRESLNSAVSRFGVSTDDFAKLSDEDFLTKYGAPKDDFVVIKDKKLGGKEVGYLKARDAEFINDYMFPEFKTIDLLAKASGYDKLTQVFKTAVTSWFPAFHIRNAISGVAQSYEVFGAAALNPASYMTALGVAKKTKLPLEFAKWRGTGEELMKEITQRFSGSSRYIADLGRHIEDLGSGKFRLGKIADPGRRLGNAIETYHKIAGTVIGLKQGKGLDEALRLAEKAGFDYSQITKFEAKIMRRLVPFYTFMRKNAGLQLDTLVHHPERIINQAKLANALSQVFGGKVTEEDVKGLPEWVLGGLGFKISGDKYLSQFGLPVEEFIDTVNKPLMKTLTSLNPLVKYPLESRLGYDFFRQKEIIDINDVAPTTGKLLYDMDQRGQLPQWFSDALNIKKREYKGKEIYEASPKTLHVLRNLPTSRLENTLAKIFDNDMDAVNKWTAFFSGAKIYDIDLEKQAYFNQKDLTDEIQKKLLDLGEGQQFKTFYIYK